MRSVESEGLVVIDDPAGGWLGRYAIAKTSRQGRQRRHDRCPYETVLDGVRTLRGACSCPDFIKGALAGCKHMLAALAHVYANRARLDAACRQEAARTAPRHVHLAWNPVAPLCGTADHLARLRLDPMAAQSTAGRDAHDGRRAGYWRATGRLSGHNGIRNWTSYEVSP
jgi:hypothetical protein